MELIDMHGAPGVVVPLDSPLRGGRQRGHRARPSARRRSSFAKGARSRSWRPFTNCWESIRYCWAGGWTTTTPTARTKNSAWPTSTAASRPAPICGKNLAAVAGVARSCESPLRKLVGASHTVCRSHPFHNLDQRGASPIHARPPICRRKCRTGRRQLPRPRLEGRRRPVRRAGRRAQDASRPSSTTLNRQANEVSKSIGKAKDAAEREARKEEGRRLREQATAAQAEIDRSLAEADAILRTIPNLTHPDAPRRRRRPGESGSPPRPARPAASSTSSRSITSMLGERLELDRFRRREPRSPGTAFTF